MQLIQLKPQLSDTELEKIIIQKKSLTTQLPYKTIALSVVDLGRNRLARALLEREPSVEARVQLNLKI
jgi:hypothetical protein